MKNLLRYLAAFSCAMVYLSSAHSTFGQEAIRPERNANRPKHDLFKLNNHKFFRYTVGARLLISGHRGGIVPGYPENSIASFEHTLTYTPAFFEIDPRLTKDSVIILMHDATLDRTTNGSGKVSDRTWEELKKLRLKDVNGKMTELRIPSLQEALIWAKGKTILNFDKKDVPMELTSRMIKELKIEDQVMITVHNAKDAQFYYEANPNIMFSAFIFTKEQMKDYEKAGIPWSNIMAYIGPKVKPENKVLIDMLHAREVRCMISSASTYDKLTDPEKRNAAYKEILKSGTDVIESDLPIEVIRAIQKI